MPGWATLNIKAQYNPGDHLEFRLHVKIFSTGTTEPLPQAFQQWAEILYLLLEQVFNTPAS